MNVMADSILDDDHKLTRSDARLFQRLSKEKAWLRDVPPEVRHKIAAKAIQAYEAADPELDKGQRIIVSLLAGILACDKADLEREKMGIAMELEIEKHGIVEAGAMPQVVYITGRPEIVVDVQDVVVE